MVTIKNTIINIQNINNISFKDLLITDGEEDSQIFIHNFNNFDIENVQI